MSDTNGRLSAAQAMGRDAHASWGMHHDLLEVKGGLWQHRWTRSLHRIQQNVKFYLATWMIWESQSLPLPSCCVRPIKVADDSGHARGGGVGHTHLVIVKGTRTNR